MNGVLRLVLKVEVDSDEDQLILVWDATTLKRVAHHKTWVL